MIRRTFLRALAAAPVAAPVIAREAAQKAGLSSLGHGAAMAGGASLPECSSNGEYAASRLREIFSPEWEKQTRDEIGSQGVGALDPDLASSRSFSLSTAVRLQRARNADRAIRNNRNYWLREFKQATGLDWLP